MDPNIRSKSTDLRSQLYLHLCHLRRHNHKDGISPLSQLSGRKQQLLPTFKRMQRYRRQEIGTTGAVLGDGEHNRGKEKKNI